MRYNLYAPDGMEIGYVTDEPEFRWELKENTPFREQIENVIERSASYRMVVAGGNPNAEDDAVTPPEEEVPVDDHGRLVRVASELPNETPVQVSKSERQTKEHIAEDLVRTVDKFRKERVYVDDPSEVPEGVEPEEGEQGGLYYDTEQIGDEENESEPWADASFEDLGSVVSEHISEDDLSQLVEELPEDATPESAIDQLTQMMQQSEEYSDEDVANLYQDLGHTFGNIEDPEEDTPTPEEVDGFELPGEVDIDTAVTVVADVLGEEAANALFGDMNAPDSGEQPDPDRYVATAAQRVPREARGELQEALSEAVSGEGGDGEGESEGEGDGEEAEQTSVVPDPDVLSEGDSITVETPEGETVEGELSDIIGDRVAIEDSDGRLHHYNSDEIDIYANTDTLLEGWEAVESEEDLEEGENVRYLTEDGELREATVQTVTGDRVGVEFDDGSMNHYNVEDLNVYAEAPEEEEDDGGDGEEDGSEEEGEKASKIAQKALEERFSRMRNERRESVVKVEELQKPEFDIEKNRTFRKAGENFELVDDLLMEAFEKQIWQDDLNKAPNMWERDDNVPQFVRSHVKEAIDKTDVLYTQFDNIPHTSALKVHEIIKDQLTDPQGWSVETVTHALEEEFDELAQEQAESIARTEIAAVLNKAREIAYDAAKAARAALDDRNITGLPDTEGPDEVDVDAPEEEREVMYYWAGPEDHRTTNICSETKDEIESRGGYVTKDELKEILKAKARKYEDEDGGLPNRVEAFVPHFNCRHTFIREDYQRVT